MRFAPPVPALSLGAGPWLAAQQGLFASSAGILACWVGAHVWGLGAPVVLTSLAVAAAAAGLARRGLAPAPLRLAWDGSIWNLETRDGARQAGQVMLMVDLGGWMLVRFVAQARPSAWPAWSAQWLSLRRVDVGAAWPLLRVALFAHHGGQPQVDASDAPGRQQPAA